MTGRLTPLALSILAVAAWAVSLGVLAARPELFLAALPGLLVLATLARPVPIPRCSIAHRVSGDRLFEGGTVTVTVTVSARSPVALVELLGPLPPGAELRSGRHRAVMALRAGDAVEWSYELRFPRRGVHDLGAIAVRVRDRLGLRGWEHRHVAPTTVRVYPRIVPLRSLPRPIRTQPSVGDYVSSALGEGIEPGDVRQFAPGDRIRHVNWRASLRLGQLYVTERHRERNADVVLMLDTLAEVGAPPETTLDQGVRAAASLATAYLARKDRVGLITYGGVMSWVRPGSGATQYERLVDALVRVDVVFTYVAKDLLRVPPRVLSPQALVIAITPPARSSLREGGARSRRAGLRPGRAGGLAGRGHARRPRGVAGRRPGLPALGPRAALGPRRAAPPRPAGPRVASPRAARGGPRGRPPPAGPAGERGMIRLLAAASAAALFAVLRLTTPSVVVVWVGLLGLALAAVAIVARWRWAATASAVVFLVGYALGLQLERRAVEPGAALGLGLALLLLLGAVDLARRAGGATVHGPVVGATLARWIGLAAGSFLAGTLAMALAAAVAGTLPVMASPLLAAAGGLGSVLVLVALFRRAG